MAEKREEGANTIGDNIWNKLQSMRAQLQEMDLKKTGKNTFSGYDYFELKDFLPSITKLMASSGVSSFISFSDNEVKLTLVNIEKPEERIEFTSPMAEASLKGNHGVQNLGAVQTYLRRYLYINAFDISESDVVNSDKGHSQATSGRQTPVAIISPQQMKMLAALVAQKYGPNNFENWKEKVKGALKLDSLNNLTSGQASSLIEQLTAKPNYSPPAPTPVSADPVPEYKSEEPIDLETINLDEVE